MRYLCLLAVLLTLPVTATAQPFDPAQGRQRRGDDRRSNDRSSGDRGSDQQRGSDQGRSDQRQADRPQSPQSNPRTPWWEQQPTPWWERQGKPSWEQPQVPAWQTMNPARTLLDREREQRQRNETIGGGSHRQFRRNAGPGVIVVPQYRYFPNTLPTQYVVTPPPPAQIVTQRVVPEPPPAPIGILRLDVEPKASVQIYVDGVFVGTPADLGDELALTPGTRRIEIRARGYKTLTFSAEIQENRTISYRGSLERDETAPAPPQTPIIVRPADTPGATKMYMIPGCYLGNVPPKAEQLRPGCDISKLTIFTP